MPTELLAQEVRQRRVGAGTLAVVLGAFGALALIIADALGGLLEEITASFPEQLRTFIGADAPGGYVVGEMFSLIFPIAVVTYAIIIGAGALAGEERDGTMAMLSAQPVTRTRLLWTKAAAALAALALVVAVNWVVMAIFILTGATDLTLNGLTAGTVHLLFLSLAFGSISFAVAAATGRPGLSSGMAGVLAVAAYLASTMLPVAGFESWAKLSPWFFYLLHSDPLREGINVVDLGVFAAIVVIAMTVAVVLFRGRDLRG